MNIFEHEASKSCLDTYWSRLDKLRLANSLGREAREGCVCKVVNAVCLELGVAGSNPVHNLVKGKGNYERPEVFFPISYIRGN